MVLRHRNVQLMDAWFWLVWTMRKRFSLQHPRSPKRIQSRAKGPKKAAWQCCWRCLRSHLETCSEKPTAKAGMQKQRCEAAKYCWTVLRFLSDLLAVKSKMISHSLSTQAGWVLEETAQTVSSMISITCQTSTGAMTRTYIHLLWFV